MDDGTGSNQKKASHNRKRGFWNVFRKDDNGEAFERELIEMVQKGREQGVLLSSEEAMIRNIFSFGNKNAKDIMIHRKQIVALDGELTFQEALESMIESSYSRYPVFLEDVDNIIGVLHIKDALAFARNTDVYERRLKDFPEIVHGVDFVPETHSLTTLFARMQSKKMHLMIVVDEYGQTSGLLSMENILEEIVGNIQDEHDEDETSISRITKDFYRMEGSTTLEEASEVLQIAFPDDYDTLNGFIIHMIDRIPEEHEKFKVEYESYIFEVQDVLGRMIQEVHVFHKIGGVS